MNNPLHPRTKRSGFTIVKLLVVIVVIAILAAISIVAYNGIQQRARAASASSALSQAAKQLALTQADDSAGSFPATSGNAFCVSVGGSGDNVSCTKGDVTYQYKQTSSGTGYCVTATSGNVSYKVTDTTSPSAGGCAGHAQGGVAAVTNVVTNPSIETNLTGWGSYLAPTRVMSTEQARFGTSAQKVTTTNDTQVLGTFFTATKTYTPGTVLNTSVWVYAPAGTSLSFSIRSAVALGSTGHSPVNFTGTGGWQQISTSYTIPATAQAYYAPMINTRAPLPATGTSYYVDGLMMAEGPLPSNYADPAVNGNWDWNGTAHASTSTGPL